MPRISTSNRSSLIICTALLLVAMSQMCLSSSIMQSSTLPPAPTDMSKPDIQTNGVSSEVRVLGSKQFIDTDSSQISAAAIATPDGGFFVSGRSRVNVVGKSDLTRQWYLKISSAPAITWESAVTSAWPIPRASSVHSLSNGGYWVLGIRYARDPEAENKNKVLKPGEWAKAYFENEYDVLQLLDERGAPLATIAVSETGQSNSKLCGAETKDGFVFLGSTASSSPQTRHTVPVIEKVDKSGKRMWLREIAQDHNDYVDVGDQVGKGECVVPKVDADGSITLSMNVGLIPVTLSQEQLLDEIPSPANNRSGVLVLKLDSNGKELLRIRHDHATDSFILPNKRGLLLVESIPPQFPVPGSVVQAMADVLRASSFGYGVRVTQLDPSLRHVVNTDDYKTGALQSIKAAYRTPEGGVLLAGCPKAGGNNYVVHISPQGAISPPLQISAPGLQQCSLFAFSSGSRTGEALLYAANDVGGSRVITLKYSK
jgi:hypothetical protein